MGSRLAGSLAAALAACALPAASAEAGLRIEVEVSERGAAPQRWIVWLDADRAAAEPARDDPQARRAIFRAGDDVAWLLEPSRRSYFQLDPRSAQELASRVAGLRDGVAQGIEMLPPEQRQGARELLGDFASPPPAAAPAARLRARGETARHAGLACTLHDLLEGERRIGELCIAAWGTGPLTRERAAAVPASIRFLRRTLAPLAREIPSLRPLAPLAGSLRVDGVPLAARGADGQRAVAVRVEEREVDPARFELPSGYARSLVPPFE